MIFSDLILIFFILLNLFIVTYFQKLKIFHYVIDKPDKVRKLHSKPTPLAGGQIICLNILIYCVFVYFHREILEIEIFFKNIKSLNFFMLAFFSIFLIGIIDDKIDFQANTKFLLLAIIITILLLFDDDLVLNNIRFSFLERSFSLHYFDVIFSVLCFLIFLNAFNMFDGINLQAISYSLFIFLILTFFFVNSFILKILIINLVTFSYLNLKNKSFLGDSGSLLLGFLISYFFIKLYNFNYFNYADQITLFMLIPGLDLIRLFISRIYRKKNPLSPDRNHLHHLLLSKYSFKFSIITILLFISFPIFLEYFKINNMLTILLTTIIYFALVFFLKRKKTTL